MIRALNWTVTAALAVLPLGGAGAMAQAAGAAEAVNSASDPTYADLAMLADSAQLVAHVQISKLAQIEPERAPGVRPGWGRFYVEAKTRAVLAGRSGLGESVRYLVDLPLDARGKPPKVKKQAFLVFGRAVAGRPGELQLAAPDSQIAWTAVTEARARGIVAEMAAAGAPVRVTGIREAIFVPGNLRGEGETQIFFNTVNDSAAMITVTHRPDAKPVWGVTFSEVSEAGQAVPPRDTLAWYRLACGLPAFLPKAANLSQTAEDQRQAEIDYRMVMTQLGPCLRNRR